jgi:hypothetical protein
MASLRCLNIYEQLDFCRLLHRQLGRFVALKNAAGVDAGPRSAVAVGGTLV